MDEALLQKLEEIPERPPRSKLEPYSDVIRELRRKRRTYQEISGFFHDHLQLSVAASTIHDFLRVRRKRAGRLREASSQTDRTSPRTQTEVRHLAETAGPIRQTTEKPLFEFDETEVLRLRTDQPGRASLPNKAAGAHR